MVLVVFFWKVFDVVKDIFICHLLLFLEHLDIRHFRLGSVLVSFGPCGLYLFTFLQINPNYYLIHCTETGTSCPWPFLRRPCAWFQSLAVCTFCFRPSCLWRDSLSPGSCSLSITYGRRCSGSSLSQRIRCLIAFCAFKG